MDLDCLACGACCAYSESWPAFVGAGDAEGIPDELVDFEHGRMQCYADRCAALVGEIGSRAQCSVYANRPLVCSEFQPGSDVCLMVRRGFGLDPCAGGNAVAV